MVRMADLRCYVQLLPYQHVLKYKQISKWSDAVYPDMLRGG